MLCVPLANMEQDLIFCLNKTHLLDELFTSWVQIVWLTDSAIYGLCSWWQIAQFKNSQILQSMNYVLGGFHTLEIDKLLNLRIHRFCNPWILCWADSTLWELTNCSICELYVTCGICCSHWRICILWNSHTIYRLMHLWVHKLKNMLIPRVGNLPSTQSTDCRVCESVNWWTCQFLECRIWKSIVCRLPICGLCNWQILTLQIDKFCNLWIVWNW